MEGYPIIKSFSSQIFEVFDMPGGFIFKKINFILLPKFVSIIAISLAETAPEKNIVSNREMIVKPSKLKIISFRKLPPHKPGHGLSSRGFTRSALQGTMVSPLSHHEWFLVL